MKFSVILYIVYYTVLFLMQQIVELTSTQLKSYVIN